MVTVLVTTDNDIKEDTIEEDNDIKEDAIEEEAEDEEITTVTD